MAKVIKKDLIGEIKKDFSDVGIAHKVKSKSLKRVYDHTKNGNPTFEGLFLSNNQLKTLGEKLAEIENGPDGVCFMIGLDKSKTPIEKTVEVIPYIDSGNNRKFYRKGTKIGKIEIEVGKATEDTLFSFVINDEGNFSKWLGPGIPGGTGTSQKTPPPFSDE